MDRLKGWLRNTNGINYVTYFRNCVIVCVGKTFIFVGKKNGQHYKTGSLTNESYTQQKLLIANVLQVVLLSLLA